MTLQLSQSNRATNYYLNEIDKVKNEFSNTINVIVGNEIDSRTDDIVDTAEKGILLKAIPDILDVPFSCFNDDFVAYYNFESHKQIINQLICTLTSHSTY